MAGGEVRTEGWDADGRADVVAVGDDPQDVVLAGLRGLLALATGRATAVDRGGTAAAPIQGKGADLAAVFADLAGDLLDQLASLGGGFAHVRLDGMLQTGDGGHSAWGYLVGDAGGPLLAALPVLEGTPSVTRTDDGRIALRFTLRRG